MTKKLTRPPQAAIELAVVAAAFSTCANSRRGAALLNAARRKKAVELGAVEVDRRGLVLAVRKLRENIKKAR